MKQSEVSVVMPVYNMEKYVGEAIDSILNQTFNNFDFLIIDDRSTDGTLEKIRQYSDKRIRIIQNNKNMGLPACENIGLRESKGKYLVRMDSDDISSPDRIEKLYNFLEAHPEIDICGSSLHLFGEIEGISNYFYAHDEIAADLIWTCSMPHGACMMRLDKIKEYDLWYDESYSVGEDWVFLMKAKDKLHFSNLKDVLYHYRRGPQSMVLQAKDDLREHNSRVYSALLSDLGISFNEHDLKLHCFLLAKFNIIPPTAQVISQARKWLNKLISANRMTKKYNEYFFEKFCEKKWNQLFYKIIPYGYLNVFAYFRAEGKISSGQFLYYSKYLINKVIGRHEPVLNSKA